MDIVDGLKVLDPDRPIREADILAISRHVRLPPEIGHRTTGHYRRRPNCSATNFSASKIGEDRLNKASAS
jgi:hypothetical protein